MTYLPFFDGATLIYSRPLKQERSIKKFIAFAALLAATTSAVGITGNWIEDNEHPYVGLIVFYRADGTFLQRCSGSLISPTKFVTAGHCVDAAAGVVSARVYFQQDAGANFNPNTGIDPVTGYPETCAEAPWARFAPPRARCTTLAIPQASPTRKM
jgi:hypothetical protein